MRSNIHPKYKKLIVKVGEDEFETKSTYHADSLLMDVDYRKHPAWTKQGLTGASASNHSVTTFNKKFGGMSFSAAAKISEKK